ncbi:MAG: AAA family ATPase [Kiritimatiellae bacterium]|nr:AAA family ATPase [Kiritimatiellia bacterium]
MQNTGQPLAKINDVSDDFAELRKNDAIYVDKTDFVHKLVSDRNSNIVFVSRPRRFGKSLTVSLLKNLFAGRRELFRGLAIEKTDWKWLKHPVIHFDFNGMTVETPEKFGMEMANHVHDRLARAGFTCDTTRSAAENFAQAIETLAEKSRRDAKERPREIAKGVVILIDEYDAPVGHALADVEKAEKIRDRMSSLYAQMKSRTGDIRFLFMTGVSKFTKLSVFSALNNIKDVSLLDPYATMFGYTEEELGRYFEPHMRVHAAKMGLSYEDYRTEMKLWYNGFRFARNVETTVYNPISVAYTLKNMEPHFTATWATTGRPSMLMNFLKREDMLKINPEAVEDVDAAEFDVAELNNLSAIALLFQSGYLTIRDYEPLTESYTLGVPDEEVRRDLCTLMAGVAARQSNAWAASLGKKLLNAKWPKFFEGLQSLYAAMAYGSTEGSVHENSYGRCLSFLLAGCGFRFRMEDVQASGRADIVADHPALTCIFELKVGEPVDVAFRQLREKGYADPYRASGKPIWLIGLSFDRETRKLVDCAARPLEA